MASRILVVYVVAVTLPVNIVKALPPWLKIFHLVIHQVISVWRQVAPWGKDSLGWECLPVFEGYFWEEQDTFIIPTAQYTFAELRRFLGMCTFSKYIPIWKHFIKDFLPTVPAFLFWWFSIGWYSLRFCLGLFFTVCSVTLNQYTSNAALWIVSRLLDASVWAAVLPPEETKYIYLHGVTCLTIWLPLFEPWFHWHRPEAALTASMQEEKEV